MSISGILTTGIVLRLYVICDTEISVSNDRVHTHLATMIHSTGIPGGGRTRIRTDSQTYMASLQPKWTPVTHSGTFMSPLPHHHVDMSRYMSCRVSESRRAILSCQVMNKQTTPSWGPLPPSNSHRQAAHYVNEAKPPLRMWMDGWMPPGGPGGEEGC